MADNFEKYSDSELFYKLQSDKQTADKAFAELYSRLAPRIFAYCRRFMGNREEAQDVFQETFVRFYQSAKQERNMTNVPAFALKIARNLCVNHLRKESPAISFEDYMAAHDDDRDEKDEMLNLIKRALKLLPDDYREIFILREYEGMSYTEIADITGETLANVKVRIFRAKQKIREILEPYMKEFEEFS